MIKVSLLEGWEAGRPGSWEAAFTPMLQKPEGFIVKASEGEVGLVTS